MMLCFAKKKIVLAQTIIDIWFPTQGCWQHFTSFRDCHIERRLECCVNEAGFIRQAAKHTKIKFAVKQIVRYHISRSKDHSVSRGNVRFAHENGKSLVHAVENYYSF